MRNEFLMALIFNDEGEHNDKARNAFKNLYQVCDKVVNASVPEYFFEGWTGVPERLKQEKPIGLRQRSINELQVNLNGE